MKITLNGLINQQRIMIICVQDKFNTNITNIISWQREKLQSSHTDLEIYANLTDDI